MLPPETLRNRKPYLVWYLVSGLVHIPDPSPQPVIQMIHKDLLVYDSANIAFKILNDEIFEPFDQLVSHLEDSKVWTKFLVNRT